jgi:hypothetical protein
MCLGPFFGHGELSAALISTSFIDPQALDRDRAPGFADSDRAVAFLQGSTFEGQHAWQRNAFSVHAFDQPIFSRFFFGR